MNQSKRHKISEDLNVHR